MTTNFKVTKLFGGAIVANLPVGYADVRYVLMYILYNCLLQMKLLRPKSLHDQDSWSVLPLRFSRYFVMTSLLCSNMEKSIEIAAWNDFLIPLV